MQLTYLPLARHGIPGSLAEGTRIEDLSTYINGYGGVERSLQVSLTLAPTPGSCLYFRLCTNLNWCGLSGSNHNCCGGYREYSGCGCIKFQYVVPDYTLTADQIFEEVIDSMNCDSRINSGFTIESVGSNNFILSARQPGIQFEIEIDDELSSPGMSLSSTVIQEGSPMGANIPWGYVVVKDDVLDGYETQVAHLPSGAANECYIGIVSGSYNSGASCEQINSLFDMTCQDTYYKCHECMGIVEEGSVWVRLANQMTDMRDIPHYRNEISGSDGNVGQIYAIAQGDTPPTGVIPIPGSPRFVQSEEDGTLVVIRV